MEKLNHTYATQNVTRGAWPRHDVGFWTSYFSAHYVFGFFFSCTICNVNVESHVLQTSYIQEDCCKHMDTSRCFFLVVLILRILKARCVTFKNSHLVGEKKNKSPFNTSAHWDTPNENHIYSSSQTVSGYMFIVLYHQHTTTFRDVKWAFWCACDLGDSRSRISRLNLHERGRLASTFPRRPRSGITALSPGGFYKSVWNHHRNSRAPPLARGRTISFIDYMSCIRDSAVRHTIHAGVV